MYLRLVHAKYKPESLSKIRQIYDEIVIPRLQKLPGCLFVCLIRDEIHRDEGISMTLWDSLAHAESYEQSGVFQELLDKIKPYLADSSEWKVQLSKDLKIEYKPVPEELVVKSYRPVTKINTKVSFKKRTPSMYLRLFSIKIKPEKIEELKKIYTEEIIPALRTIKGCRYAYLTESIEDNNEAISITVWDNKKDAENYEKSELFNKLLEKTKHLFAELYQWKMTLEKEVRGHAVTSEDTKVNFYSVITGKIFQ